MSTILKQEQDPHFFALPTELIVGILYRLDVQSILKCKRVSRLFAAIIDASVELQYKIELAAANLEDGPPGPLVAGARLGMLKTHQRAWNAFAWTTEKSVQLPDVRLWDFIGGVIGVDYGDGNFLRFMQLPSICRGVNERDWIIKDIGFHVQDFTFDPSQDLLVMIEVVDTPMRKTRSSCFRIHLRLLSSGQPHPLAADSTVLSLIPAVTRGDINQWSYTVQVFGDLLGFMLRSYDVESSTELVFWNWKTGTIQKFFWADGSSLQGYSFLSDRLVILSVVQQFPPNLSLKVVVLDDPSDEPVNIFEKEILCSFSYPSLSLFVFGLQVSMRTEYLSSAAFPGLPFITSRKDRLLVITTKSDAPGQFAVLFVPLSTILAKVDGLILGRHGVVFPWVKWGPQGTRMISLDPSDTWFSYAHGMKFVSPSQDKLGFQLYDFNQHSLRRSLQSGEAGEDGTTLLAQPSTCADKGEMFSQLVTTSLPCRITSIPAPSDGSDIMDMMLAEDGLIMVSKDEVDFRMVSI